MSGILTPAPRVPWSADELATMEREVAAGATIGQIANLLGRSWGSVCDKSKKLRAGIRASEPQPARVDRWVCQNCGIRSDASLEFGCRACLPMRSMAA